MSRFPYIILPNVEDHVALIQRLYPMHRSAYVALSSSVNQAIADWRHRRAGCEHAIVLVHRQDRNLYMYPTYTTMTPSYYTKANSIDHFVACVRRLSSS